ncbi:MAG: tRNA pseudouridine(38-40) synthase TruA [Clostridia bacterium]|nr:tRNA pseudouridine(38-40) synthase TruA [Clostridia bacterium]
MRYMIHLSYDGSRYSGWQRQGNSDKTIAGKLESILNRLDEGIVTVHGAGRTDAGVHALDQTATFDLAKPIDPADVMAVLNEHLPEDIAVISCQTSDSRFHARLNAVGKIYRYTVRTDPVKDVFQRRYQWYLGRPLELAAMKQAAAMLTGTHDFTSFATSTSSKHSAVRTVRRIDILERDGTVTLEYEGNGFLYNMVRIMTGTLCEIGLGQRSAGEIPGIISARDRARAGMTAPAQGLTLVSVLYPEGSTDRK